MPMLKPFSRPLAESTDQRKQGNRAVVKALTILEHLLAYKSGRSLTQLAEDLQLPVSSVHDIVRTLVKMGYLQSASGHAGTS